MSEHPDIPSAGELDAAPERWRSDPLGSVKENIARAMYGATWTGESADNPEWHHQFAWWQCVAAADLIAPALATAPRSVPGVGEGEAEGTEPCQDCGRFNGLLWNSPQPLWQEVNGRYSGLLCPRCFNARAREAGISLTWVPMVVRRDGVMTTNWWGDPIRDRLLMGEPDPHFHDDELAQVPQGHWGEIAQALGWSYETPYPDENRNDRMEGVTYKDSGVNAEATTTPPEHSDEGAGK